jgi:predicted nucleic acid-binding protein
MLRHAPKTPLPRTRHIETVAFDQASAYTLAERLPLEILKAEQDRSGLPFNYIKYDALIVACAVRHRAEMLITIDERMLSLAKTAGVRAPQPSYFDRLSDGSDLNRPA